MDRDPFDFDANPPPADDDVERPEGGDDDPALMGPVLEALKTVRDPEIPMDLVERAGLLQSEADQPRRPDGEPGLLEVGDDFPGLPRLDRVRLDDAEGERNGHESSATVMV